MQLHYDQRSFSVIPDQTRENYAIDLLGEFGEVITVHLSASQLRELTVALKKALELQESHRNAVELIDDALSVYKSSTSIFAMPETEVTIYVKDHLLLHQQDALVNACGEFMEALGFELKAEEEPVISSFWKRLQFLFKKNVTFTDMDRLFEKGKQALELKHVELPSAEQTEKLASATEKMVNALNSFQTGAIRLGNLLVIKHMRDGVPQLLVHQLTIEQALRLNNKPETIKDVELLLSIVTHEPSYIVVQDSNVEDIT